MKKNMVIGFYGHPEYYPPTLNALTCLADKYDNVCIVHRNYPSFDWQYTANIKLIPNGKETPIHELENANLANKIILFIRFTRILFRQILQNKPHTILLYDSIAVLAYWLIKPYIKKPAVLWYHNHDVTDHTAVRKYSIGWWAWKAERLVFPALNIFSLPAIERQVCFPMDKLKGAFYFLPNYPSLKLYNRSDKDITNGTIKILYQGSIAPMHGLEEILEVLKKEITSMDLQLILKGFVSPEYLSVLYETANKLGVRNRLIYIGPSGYKSVIENAAQCNIGIGIHKKNDIMNNTLGTSSNKIYEYAASSMPVILYDNAHFRNHLQTASWAFFTDCSVRSLSEILHEIAANYHYYSTEARNDFERKFNFENYFNPIISRIGSTN